MRGLGTYLRQKRESIRAAAARGPTGDGWREQVENEVTIVTTQAAVLDRPEA
jgi:hypothetical protein